MGLVYSRDGEGANHGLLPGSRSSLDAFIVLPAASNRPNQQVTKDG